MSIKRDLKSVILFQVISLFVLSFLAISLYGHYNDKNALSEFSREYSSKYADSLIARIEKKTSAASAVSKLVASWIEDTLERETIHHLPEAGPLKSPLERLEQKILSSDQASPFLRDLFSNFDNLASFYIGTANGNFWQLRRVSKEDRLRNEPQAGLPLGTEYSVRTVRRTDNNSSEQWFYYNQGGKLLENETVVDSPYDPRSRPWYNSSADSLLSAYRTSSTKKLVMTAAYPLTGGKDNCYGVVGADLDMKRFSSFLQEGKISKGAILYIVDDNDNIIASSDPNTPMLRNDDSARTMVLRELKDTPLWQAIQIYKDKKDDQFSMNFQEKTYVVNFLPFTEAFQKSAQKKWRLMIILPLDDILSIFLEARNDSFSLYIFIFALVLIQIVILARRISDPIEEITEEATKILRFNFDGNFRTDSKIEEVKTLGNTIQAMKVSLNSFTKYMPKNLVIKLLEKEKSEELGGESKKLAIFFSDIASFTTVSEAMSPPDLMEHISEYFENLTQIILHEEGTIDKYIGDSIMAFWGAPDADTLKCQHACRAALLCQDALSTLNTGWRQQGKPAFETRMGIHVGEVVVGNMGSSERMNYTVIGDSVNLASRLEGVNKMYGTKILISEGVYEEIKKDFLCCPLDIVAVKGKKKGVKIFELLAQWNAEEKLGPSQEQEEFVEIFSRAFEFYLKMNWPKAIELFKTLKKENPVAKAERYQTIIDMYVKRCTAFIKTPPDDNWDGVFHLQTK